MIRILIANDHGVMRKGLRLQLEEHDGIEIMGDTSDGRDAVRRADELRRNVVIMDIGMPNLNGIEGTQAAWAESLRQRIRSRKPDLG